MPYDKNQKYPEYKIYKLVCDDTDLFYIGSTRDFTTRKSRHKRCCNNPTNKEYNCRKYQTIREFGSWENWRMVVIDILYDVTKLEAEIREEQMRMELKSLLNMVKASCGGIPREEYDRLYREENMDRIREREKKYYQENKEQIKLQRREKIECNCGSKFNQGDRARHIRTKKHQLYLENET
tara:strand:+ start:325 stop:867 length:543 start_codon:yes stop_codon:yes gene_type:complete